MKRETIEKLLKGLGVAEDKLKGAVDTIMTENGNDIERLKTSETSLKTQLKTANDMLEKFKDVDIESIKGEEFSARGWHMVDHMLICVLSKETR